ncbi:NAD(P)-binding protein [Thiocystis violascens]|uniref:NADPH-dependent glutamate synthase beta chain-like oxidoreductase n=1 Tax=Thiocystis violascens (strain ATCC 17096 / DSM 198 / 6111) TaxID=765911 RepID=I3Y6J3_THIV6|nr:NAD(P)-binding protein [Thiocystis violascens]AFL72611.1 NADPH-dependent glutamate synthase beta chain-like oxidoreductase [Thiocystis violascens DSM 198]
MATSSDEMKTKPSWRRFEDGNHVWDKLTDKIFNQDTSHKCPTYVHKTPPCQGSCPSGEDIRGWLQIVRGLEQPPAGMDRHEYAFRRSTDANPFPSMMGRVCPAPCQDGCNRNELEDFVGINAVEQFIGDTAIANGYKFDAAPADTGKRVAIIGGGPAGLAAAYNLRRKGHACTIFESNEGLGGMFRFGIPGYRVPRDKLDAEIQRILDLGQVEVKLKTRVGTDVSVEQLEKDYDAILWAIGCQSGRGLPVPGWQDTPNCVSGVAFLKAYNEGRMKFTAGKVVCVGGGDTSIDVVSVARRLGHITKTGNSDLPETVIRDGYVAHDAANAAAAEGAEVTLTSLFTRDKMTASEHEVEDANREGVTILDGVMPVEVIKDANGRATGLKVADCVMTDGRPTPVDGTERVLAADLIVSAIGQGGDLSGLEKFDNGRGLMDSDKFYQVPGKAGHFVAGDIIRPHLLTTAIGQAWIAVESIDAYINQAEHKRRPKVDVHHFNLLDKMTEAHLAPEAFKPAERGDMRGTSSANYAIHNYEDRSGAEVIPHDELFLGHFNFQPRNLRKEEVPSAEDVLGHFHERVIGLTEAEAIDEAKRCMSCGMCFECDNCVIFCPQDAVFRVDKNSRTTGRYVDTDYARCIGCHICADVCPTGYIKMGLGE